MTLQWGISGRFREISVVFRTEASCKCFLSIFITNNETPNFVTHKFYVISSTTLRTHFSCFVPSFPNLLTIHSAGKAWNGGSHLDRCHDNLKHCVLISPARIWNFGTSHILARSHTSRKFQVTIRKEQSTISMNSQLVRTALFWPRACLSFTGEGNAYVI